jgi:Domain of unknown function (DUF1707)/Cell wall-active antibiotics response 4TMS YvqF
MRQCSMQDPFDARPPNTMAIGVYAMITDATSKFANGTTRTRPLGFRGMSDLPVPDDRHLMRVSDADREQVTERLREAAGEGRITLDELDTRLDAAYAAKTYAELEVITRDLPLERPASLAMSGSGVRPAERIGGMPKSRLSLAVLSGARRKGAWVVPPVYTAVALLGGVDMDLRDARFSERDVKIRAFAMLGGIDIVVPEDIEVDVAGVGIMGGFDHKESRTGSPGSPRLRVTGFAFLGGVNVKQKSKRRRLRGGTT